MNNSLIAKKINDKRVKEKVQVEKHYADNLPPDDKEGQLVGARENFSIVSRLLSNRDFQRFCVRVITIEIEAHRDELESEIDPNKVARLQGLIEGKRRLLQLERDKVHYKAKITKLSKTNGKETN